MNPVNDTGCTSVDIGVSAKYGVSG